MTARLLDTHVFIWMATGDKRLTPRVRVTVLDPDTRVFVSVVTWWEIVLKQRSPEFHLPQPFGKLMERSGFDALDLAFDTPKLIEGLPDIHRDPFDRILIAQALKHDLMLVSADAAVLRYPVPIFW